LNGGRHDPIAAIKGGWKGEGGREADLEVCSCPHPVLLGVFFLSLPVTPGVEWQVSRVIFSSTHCPLVFCGTDLLEEGLEGLVSGGARRY